MGLLDKLAGDLGSKVLGGGSRESGLMAGILSLIDNPQTGGLSGLIQTFQQRGLGDAVTSWISSGPNQAVSGEQIQTALGAEKIQHIANQAGIPDTEAANGLATLFPQLIDKLTPNGTLPDSGLLNQGLNMLKSKLLG